jgi:hypothetical protein
MNHSRFAGYKGERVSKWRTSDLGRQPLSDAVNVSQRRRAIERLSVTLELSRQVPSQRYFAFNAIEVESFTCFAFLPDGECREKTNNE